MVDTDTINDIVSSYRPRIWAFIYSQVHNPTLADDLTQEVFVSALRNLEQFRGESSTKTWLFSIAKNKCRDHFRTAWFKRYSLTHNLETSSAVKSPEDIALDQIMYEQALKQLFSLPKKYREVVMLHTQEQMTFREISEVIGVPERTVRTRYRRAIEKLRFYLKTEGEETGMAAIERHSSKRQLLILISKMFGGVATGGVITFFIWHYHIVHAQGLNKWQGTVLRQIPAADAKSIEKDIGKLNFHVSLPSYLPFRAVRGGSFLIKLDSKHKQIEIGFVGKQKQQYMIETATNANVEYRGVDQQILVRLSDGTQAVYSKGMYASDLFWRHNGISYSLSSSASTQANTLVKVADSTKRDPHA